MLSNTKNNISHKGVKENKSHKKKNNSKKIAAVVAVVSIAVAGISLKLMEYDGAKNTESVTKETIARTGNLTLGITESGTVEIGSVTQSFDQATGSVSTSYSSSESSSYSSSSGTLTGASGMNNKSSAGNTVELSAGMSANGSSSSESSSSDSSSTSDASLIVEKVYISSGQKVEKGDPVLKITKSSIAEVKEVYEAAVESAELALKQAEIERDNSKLDVEYEYKARIAAGESAKTTYTATLKSLDAAVTSAENEYNTAKKMIKALPAQIKALQKQLKAEAGAVTNNSKDVMEDSEKSTDLDNALSVSDNSDGSTGTATSIKNQISQLKAELAEYKSRLSGLKAAVAAAKKARSVGKVTAKQTYDAAMLEYKNAKTLYEVALDGIEEDVESAGDNVADAKQELKDFNSYVGTGMITAECSGTVMSVGYSEGDSLSGDTDIATYMDSDAVTITVSVVQEDISQIKVGDTVNVNLAAYEDETYHATVTSISTTSTGTTTVSYPVVVTITGDVSKIYSGMSADVTFVTEEAEDVLYVSKKAVTTDGEKSYVTKKNADGTKSKIQVVTGFSDGHNVEIEGGLSDGDIVLIESQVSE